MIFFGRCQECALFTAEVGRLTVLGEKFGQNVSSQAGYQTGDDDLTAFVRVLADALQYMPSMSDGPICYHTSTVYFWTGNYQGSTASLLPRDEASGIMEAVIPLACQTTMANIAGT